MVAQHLLQSEMFCFRTANSVKRKGKQNSWKRKDDEEVRIPSKAKKVHICSSFE
jgi:hypothetical protein